MTDKLGALTDELNTQITAAEQALAVLNLGVTAAVSLNNGAELRFGKYNEHWRLIYNGGGVCTDTPLVNASRETRLRAVYVLDDLLAALRLEAESQSNIVQRASQHVQAFITRVTLEGK